MALLKENKNINMPQKKQNLIHRMGKLPLYLTFFIPLASGGLALPDPLFTFHIFSVLWLTIVSIYTLVCLFQGDERAHVLFL